MSGDGNKSSRGRIAAARDTAYPQGGALLGAVARRHRTGRLARWVLQAAIVLAILALTALLANTLNQAFGYVAIESDVSPLSIGQGGRQLDDLSRDELVTLLRERLSSGVLRRLEAETPLATRSRAALRRLTEEYVVKPDIVASWPLATSLLSRGAIVEEVQRRHPEAQLVFRSWVSIDLLTSAQSGDPARAGIRPALLGSLWTMIITLLVAFPVGVGAAIYLEEYAQDTLLRRIIETNIDNLAGVPSIIYGMLGLAVFVRLLQPLTSGAALSAALSAGDASGASGRTVLAAGLTLSLLVLPLIIISAREALRAVPLEIRQASLALGATHWQTIWHHVLPEALPGILTGAILSLSRAIGETAPLVIVGASTFVAIDPTSPFSKFTTLPVQVYQWTLRPQDQFRNLAAATILVLLVLLLALNASAIVLRNRMRKERA